MSQNTIQTSAEMAEDSALRLMDEVHCHPVATPLSLPPALMEPFGGKSAAQWAYERVIQYIRNFEAQLDNDHEVAMGFVGGDTGVMRIEGLGYYDPDIVTFFGIDGTGTKTQLIQHVGQLNVLLRAMPKQSDQAAPNRIGFRLGQALERDNATT